MAGRCALLLLALGCTEARAERLPIRTYTTADGLAHNRILRIVRDAAGFLWFCTLDGLSRFDGRTFVTFRAADGLPGAAVSDLLETSTGEILVATNGGLAVLEAAPRPLFTLVPAVGRTGPRSLAVNVVRQTPDGTIWAGTGDGLYRLDAAGTGRSLRHVEIGIPDTTAEDGDVNDLIDDGEGGIWVAAPSGLFRRWKDGRTARYTGRDEHSVRYIHDLFRDSRGQLWAGSMLNGLLRFHPAAADGAPAVDVRVTAGPDPTRSLPTSWLFQIFEASDGRIWLATARGLIAIVSDAGGAPRFQAYGPRNGVRDTNVTSINEDTAGNLWLGTQSAGVMRLSRDGFRWYGHEDGIESVGTLVEDGAGALCFRGNVIDGAPGDALRVHVALGCLDGDELDSFVPPGMSDLTWGWVREQAVLRGRSGEWWVGTGKGVYRYAAARRLTGLRTMRPSAIYGVKEGLPAWQVFRLFEDSLGRIWISIVDAARNGLARLDPASGAITDLTATPGLPSFRDDRPRSFAEDRHGQIWLGFNAGLVRYAGGRFTLFGRPDGLPPGSVRHLHVDRGGRLWLASSGSGLVRVDHLQAAHPTFVRLTTTDGLSSNLMEVITEDDAGRIYVGGGADVDQLDPGSGHIRHFTVAGNAGGAILAAFKDRHGSLWFGTSTGIARLTPPRESRAVSIPAFITGVRVMGVSQPMSPLGEREIALGDLAPGQHLIEVDFTGLTFAAGEARYEYRLDGVDESWNPIGGQRTVTLASLPAGSYRLRIRSATPGHAGASLAFTVLPPFWRRWWAVGLEAAGVIGAILLVHRRRVARVVELADMRTRIALDLHDDIGANLTRIALLSEVAQRSSSGPDGRAVAGGAPLESIARIARESAGSMSDIVWAINPARDSRLDLVRRMREHADEVFVQRGIALRFSTGDTSPASRMNSAARRDVFLIFKEAVNNAARHARCTRVTIEFAVERSRLRLVVADDGVHFDAACDDGGEGIASMYRRAARLRATLAITPAEGGGTAITLECPL